MMAVATVDEILDFWFGAPVGDAEELFAKAQRWFLGGPAMDAEIRERFGADVERAVRGELEGWTGTARGSLAVIILIDQLTRHVYRDEARMYAGDVVGQGVATRAFERGFDAELGWEEKMFLLTPLMHAESLAAQTRAYAIVHRLAAQVPPLYSKLWMMAVEQAAKYGGIIRRFGRFPHRNAILGRASTADELAFLAEWDERVPPRDMRGLPRGL